MYLVIYFEPWTFACVRFGAQLPLPSHSTKPSPSHYIFHIHGKVQEYGPHVETIDYFSTWYDKNRYMWNLSAELQE